MLSLLAVRVVKFTAAFLKSTKTLIVTFVAAYLLSCYKCQWEEKNLMGEICASCKCAKTQRRKLVGDTVIYITPPVLLPHCCFLVHATGRHVRVLSLIYVENCFFFKKRTQSN